MTTRIDIIARRGSRVAAPTHDKRPAPGRDLHRPIQTGCGGHVLATVVATSVRLEESPAHAESIVTFTPDSTGATEYYRLCEEVIDRA